MAGTASVPEPAQAGTSNGNVAGLEVGGMNCDTPVTQVLSGVVTWIRKPRPLGHAGSEKFMSNL